MPLSNREFLQQRSYVASSSDQERIKQLGLPIDKNYFFMALKSVELKEVPVKKGLVRANTTAEGYWIESIGHNVKFIGVYQQDFGGNIPKMVLNQLASSEFAQSIINLMNHYKKKYEVGVKPKL